MPGFAAHYLFGAECYKLLYTSRLRKIISNNATAYALGLQGPDMFFYYIPSYLFHKPNIGALAHSKDTGAFFANLIQSRSLFRLHPARLAIADAYIAGFLGHYTLDSTIHPYVYAFTHYTPEHPPKNVDYFGQHAYFETEIDQRLLFRHRGCLPSEFNQAATIRLTPIQKKVIIRMLSYAYRKTYPGILASPLFIAGAPFWMRLSLNLFRDSHGQKKVLFRWLERYLFGHAYLSPMVPSDHYSFVCDPLNTAHNSWAHPWTKRKSSASFDELYADATTLYLSRLLAYEELIDTGFDKTKLSDFLSNYGNLSFLSGLPC